jgi:hypothetical protein
LVEKDNGGEDTEQVDALHSSFLPFNQIFIQGLVTTSVRTISNPVTWAVWYSFESSWHTIVVILHKDINGLNQASSGINQH